MPAYNQDPHNSMRDMDDSELEHLERLMRGVNLAYTNLKEEVQKQKNNNGYLDPYFCAISLRNKSEHLLKHLDKA